MSQANHSPTNPRTTQCHNCMQQALEAEGVCNPQGACQGGGGERGEDVYCVGKSVAKKQHIKSFLMGPAQHKQFHCLMAIHLINYEVPFTKLECPALE